MYKLLRQISACSGVRFGICLIFGIFTAQALTVNFVVADYNSAVQLSGCNSNFPVVIARLQQNINGDSFVGAMIAILCTVFYYCILRRVRRLVIPIAVVTSLIFAFVNIIALSMYHLHNWDFVFGNKYQFFLSIFCTVGLAIFLYAIAICFFYFMDTQKLEVANSGCVKTRIYNFWNEHTTLVSFFVILLGWLPWIVTFYPGSLSYDSAYQLQQFLGVNPYTAHHPILSTWLIGGCYRIGNTFVNDNFGIFLYVMLQTMLCAFIFSQVIGYAKKLGCATIIQALVLSFYTLLIGFSASMQVIIKDTLFMGLFVFYVLLTMKTLQNHRNSVNDYKTLILYCLASILLCLLRNNGLIVVVPTLVLLLFVISNRRNKLQIGFALILVVLLCPIFNLIALNVVSGIEGSRGEALSIPFQQTARYVRDFGNEVTADEKRAIEAVLSYETLGEDYNPEISDPVKQNYFSSIYLHPNEKEILKDYFIVWFRMFFKHPEVYIQATLENSYAYYSFTPQTQFSEFIIMDGIYTPFVQTFSTEIHYVNSDGSRQFIKNISETVMRLPLVSQLHNPAVYTWILILISIYSISKRRWEMAAVIFPLFMTLLVCMASPINGMWRYYMPIAAALPVVFIAVIGCGKRGNRLNKSQ